MHSDAQDNPGERAPTFTRQPQPPRVLHMVRIDDIEFIFYDLDRALEKLASDPQATLEPITVH